MKKIFKILFIITFIMPFSLQAMHKQKKKNTDISEKLKIEGTWQLNYIEGGDVNKLFGKKLPVIRFDATGKMISGDNGCNSFSGPIKIESNKIFFVEPFLQTLKSCEGEGEQRFMEALNRVQSFAFPEEDLLDFIAGDRGALQFSRVKKP